MRAKAKEKCRVLSDSGIKDAVAEEYCTAFRKGYSVVELGRIVGLKSVRFVHTILVKHRVVPTGKPGRQKKDLVPEKMENFLKIRGLAFSQWCVHWGFAQEDVAAGIANRDPLVLNAIRRDFPKYYELITGIEVLGVESGPPFEKFRKDIEIKWIDAEGCYFAVIRAAGLEAYGVDCQDALRAVINKYRDTITIKRLASLPALRNSGRKE
jgi:hypothetical protein